MLELFDEIAEPPVDVERVHDLLARLLARYYQQNRAAPPTTG
jgi:hypothetical protein